MLVGLVHDHFDKNHLDKVVAEMKKLGTPKIKAVYIECHDMYVALEGCHRLRACEKLGIVPEFELLEYDDVYELKGGQIGIDSDCKISDILDDCHKSTMIVFD